MLRQQQERLLFAWKSGAANLLEWRDLKSLRLVEQQCEVSARGIIWPPPLRVCGLHFLRQPMFVCVWSADMQEATCAPVSALPQGARNKRRSLPSIRAGQQANRWRPLAVGRRANFPMPEHNEIAPATSPAAWAPPSNGCRQEARNATCGIERLRKNWARE